jgi:hypothetical protein
MKYSGILIFLIFAFSFVSCTKKYPNDKVVLAIPVYGQSLATGEEAIRITNFDTLSKRTQRRVLTENLNEKFGYLSDTRFKQWMKKLLGDRRRAFELSVYGMSEVIIDYFDKKGYGDSILISIFPGGQGASSIVDLGKGSPAYIKFLNEIEKAHKKAKRRGWDFMVPAFCWMQGEDDIVWGKSSNYKKDLKEFQMSFNRDVKAITKQTIDVVCITYQTNCLTLSENFSEHAFESKETSIPQGQMELIRDDSLFMASGPTYPYSFVDERVHIDGISQKHLGHLAGLSVIRLLEAKRSNGLTPSKISVSADTIFIKFNVPRPPLTLDTIAILKANNYGFSVIDSGNVNILQKVILENNLLKLYCKKPPVGSKVRYAVNGIKGKSGYEYGSRGNLRDSQGDSIIATILDQDYPLHNWCYQFDMLVF